MQVTFAITIISFTMIITTVIHPYKRAVTELAFKLSVYNNVFLKYPCLLLLLLVHELFC